MTETAPSNAPAAARIEKAAEARALDLALIGNCRIAALVNTVGRIVWWCFPAFDLEPGVLPPAVGR